MPISVQCPGCDKNLKVKDELAGKRFKCPGCGQVVVAPAPEPTTQPAPTPYPRQQRPTERPRQALSPTVDLPSDPGSPLDGDSTRAFERPTNSRRTTDPVPIALAAGREVTGDFTPSSSSVDGCTAAYVPDQGREPMGPKSERGPPSVSVPGYEIEGVLGRGGMGVVYKARHLSLKRIVALKMVLAGGHAGPRELARFRIEAEAVARLQHPNIVQIHDVGVADGHPYCALEFVEGGNLAAKLDGKPMPAKEAAKLVEALARAMHLAHSRNVVHRDLKPANILLTADGTPKITDFGLARQLDSDSGETQAGAVMGTPSYMAPEQASGRTHEAGPVADVYSMGALLYVCLAGRPPFQGKTIVETLDQVRTQEPVPPSRWQGSVPLDLDTICLKCLRKEPEKRYASAAELADELVRYQQGEPILARPVGGLERAVKYVRRNPWVLMVACSSCVSCLVVVIVALNLGGDLREARYNAMKADAKSQEASAHAKKAEEKLTQGEWLVYASMLSLAQSAFGEGNEGVALKYLDKCQWNLRGWEHRHLWTRFNAKQTLLGHISQVTSVAFSPDGKRIVTGSHDQTAKVWDADKGLEDLALKGHTSGVTSVAFSLDGKRLVTGSIDQTAKVWDADKGKEVLTLKGHTGFVTSVAFSPDGKRIVTGSHDQTGKVWDADKGLEVLALKGHKDKVTSVAFSPDGKRIVTASYDKTVKVWDADKGLEVLTLKGHTGGVFSVAFSPDGKNIVTGSGDKTAKVWDADKGLEVLTLKGHTGGVFSVAFSPDGKNIVTGSYDKTAKVWDAGKGKEVLTLKGHTLSVTSVAFSPDGKRIIAGSYDKTAKVWDADKGQEIPALKGHANGVTSVVFSPDGKRIVTGSKDKTAKVWDADMGLEILTLKGHIGPVYSVGYSPDGKRIVTGSHDQTAKVWDADKGLEVLALKGHTGGVFSVAFSPDGKRIVTGSLDKTAKVWDADKGQEALALNGHIGVILSVAFSPDSKRIVTSSQDGTAKVWDADKGREALTLKGHTNAVTSVAFSPDGKRIVTGSFDQTAKVWDADKGLEVLTLKGHTDLVYSVAFSPDGKRIVTGSLDKTAKVWDADKGQDLLTLKGHTDRVTSVVFSPNGKRIVTGGYDQMTMWDADRGQEVLTLKGHTGEVSSVVFSPDGKRIVTGSQDQTVKVWDTVKGQELFSLKGHTVSVSSVAFSADGKRIFAWDTQKKVLAWSAEDGTPLDPINPPAPAPPGPARSPDGFLHVALKFNYIVVIDTRKPRNDNAWPLPDAAERRRYHTEQAAQAELQKQWFAAGFHLRRVLRDDPENAAVKTRLTWAAEELGPARLPALLRGKDQFVDNAERLAFAQFANDHKKFAVATWLWAEALANDPMLGEDRQTQHCYHAACIAAQAAAGQGKDEPPLDDAAKTKHRRQALDWLKVELIAWGKLFQSGPPQVRWTIVQTLDHWQNDPKLAGIRDAAALAKLPVDEQKAFTKLWADVEALGQKALELLIGPGHEVGQGLELRGQLDKQTQYRVSQVKLTAGKTYIIDMIPDKNAFQPYLVLSDATGKKLAEDSAIGGGRNARIVFRAEKAGTFRIYATSFNGGAGAFTLTVREKAPPPKKDKK